MLDRVLVLKEIHVYMLRSYLTFDHYLLLCRLIQEHFPVFVHQMQDLWDHQVFVYQRADHLPSFLHGLF